MKKILFILLICLIPILNFGQSQFKRGIEVGTTNTRATIDSISKYGDIFRVYSGATRIYDDKLVQDATELSTVVPTLADSTVKYVTPTQMASYYGGGSGVIGQYYETSGEVGGLGFPEAGDSTDYNSYWVGRKLLVIREGREQQQHADNTEEDGFRFNNVTGVVTFRPVLSDGEQIIYRSTNTIQYTTILPQGGGGEAESTLLTGLRAYWKLDETSGTTVNDALGVYNGTTTGLVNQPGKFGVAETFSAASTQTANMGTVVGDVGTNDWTFGGWFYVTASGAFQGIMGNWGDVPYYYVQVNDDDYIEAVLNFAGVNLKFQSNITATTSTWYHVVITCDRSGLATMYVNKTAQTDTEDISAHSAVSMTNTNRFSIGGIGNPQPIYYYTGTIDEPAIWLKALSSAEVTEWYDKTHPFN